MNLIKLFVQLIKKHKFLTLLVILVSVLVILGGVGLFSVSAYIIAFCGLTPSIAEIMVPVVGVRFFGISRGILRYLERLISHDTTFRLLSDLRSWLYEKISDTNTSELMLLDKEDAFTRLVDDIERLQEFYLRTFNPYITGLIIGIIGTFMLNIFSPLIGIIFVIFYSFSVFVLPLLVNWFTHGLYKKHIEGVSKSKGMFLEVILGLSDIIASSALKEWKKRLEKQLKGNYSIEKKLAFWKSLSTALINLAMNYALLIAVCIGGSLLVSGRFNPVYIPVIAYMIFALFEGAQPVAVILQKIEESKISADRVYDLSNRCTSSKEEIPQIHISNKKGIHLQNIGFRYPSMESIFLKDITLSLSEGKKIALVGSSGSGKSTISYLLLGWIQPIEGAISYEGNPEELFSVVNQNVYFFNTTIENNLRIGNIKASDNDLLKVLKQVELFDFIEALPDKIHSQVGEGDLKLSGGQRQRLAIARALLRDTPYLIFDEITAGLDIQTEKKVMTTLLKNTMEKGLLVLTHRLIEMEEYDEIIVMENGEIKERGSHKELLDSGDLYKRMYNLQSL